MCIARSLYPISVLWVLACNPGTVPTSPTTTLVTREASHRQYDDRIPLYGLGDAPLDGCDSRGFRAFDFWLGNWNVYGQDGQLGGTNSVTSELKGCAIEEHWTDAAGGRGRSINTYDAGSGKWNQLWMDATGLAIILEGESSPGQISMSGDTPRFIGGPIISNRITWSRLSPRRVRQFWEVSEDGRQTWNPVFDGDYRKERSFTPTPETPNGFCDSPARVRFHWFDFIVGDWELRDSDERGRSLGRLSVQKDLTGCLLEWNFHGHHGYRGTAFAAFHFPSLQWHRTWIDENGMRIALIGQLEGNNMVFTGTRVVKRGRNQMVRVTWEPVDEVTVSERWETSGDQGVTWAPALSLTLNRVTP